MVAQKKKNYNGTEAVMAVVENRTNQRTRSTLNTKLLLCIALEKFIRCLGLYCTILYLL